MSDLYDTLRNALTYGECSGPYIDSTNIVWAYNTNFDAWWFEFIANKKTRMFHIMRGGEIICEFPADMRTEEQYFQYSLVLDKMNMTLEECRAIILWFPLIDNGWEPWKPH